MTTTEPSDEDIERSVRSEPAQDVLDAEKPLNKATMAAYKRAKKASKAQDAASTAQVAEYQRKREGIVSGRAPVRGRQSALFDF